MERDEQPSTSDDGKSLALRKMVFEQLEPILLNIHEHEPDQQMVLKIIEMMLNFFRRAVLPMVIGTRSVVLPMDIGNGQQEMRKAVIEESQTFLPGGIRNDVPKERILLLKFSDEVLDPVHTSRELRGIKGYPLQVALLDETGKTVTRGPESSASVEIVLADAGGKDEGHNVTHGNFERRIIKTGDKEKPHFAKSVYINLEGGVGNLIDVKLGQPSEWTKNRKCSLGVRLVEKFRGITVQEGWTAPFLVKDNRGELNKKYDRPALGSEVWRLEGIDRKGEPRKRLEEEKIKTVRDFLFWLSVNHEGLQKILNAHGIKWKTIVEHARTCSIDDKRIFFHKSSTEPQMGFIYDVVGHLKGVINESRFVPIDNLSADKKEHAHKLLSSVLEQSAFVERYKTFFDDEASLLQRYPHISSDISASTNSSIQQSWNGNDLTYQPTGTDSSSPSISPLTISIYDYLPSEYDNGGTPTDQGCRRQNAGTSESVGESSRSETPFHRVYSMNSFFEDIGGFCSTDDLVAFVMNYEVPNTQTHSHTNEPNAEDGSAAPVEPQAVNTSNPPKRWKRVFSVMMMISKRDVAPEQKRQKVG